MILVTFILNLEINIEVMIFSFLLFLEEFFWVDSDLNQRQESTWRQA